MVVPEGGKACAKAQRHESMSCLRRSKQLSMAQSAFGEMMKDGQESILKEEPNVFLWVIEANIFGFNENGDFVYPTFFFKNLF